MTQVQQTSSTTAGDADDLVYTVVINDEEQYSIWPTFRDVPGGWREVGVRGPKAECLAHIETVWTDMRPASLRHHMDAAA
ncbi:MbtH family NRPS accessory protein [Paraburkholderia xenovorans]|uniref:MbtH family protein n=1 Tax=Paraburkholderia xenovorans TaxID=36873 RepID=UPI0038BA8D7E